MTQTDQHRREWHIRVVWDAGAPHHPQVFLRPVDQGEEVPWLEFTDQDLFLRHLWFLIDSHAGLR